MQNFTQRKQNTCNGCKKTSSIHTQGELHTPQHIQDKATGDVEEATSQYISIVLNMSCLYFRKQTSGYRVEVAQHNETAW